MLLQAKSSRWHNGLLTLIGTDLYTGKSKVNACSVTKQENTSSFFLIIYIRYILFHVYTLFLLTLEFTFWVSFISLKNQFPLWPQVPSNPKGWKSLQHSTPPALLGRIPEGSGPSPHHELHTEPCLVLLSAQLTAGSSTQSCPRLPCCWSLPSVRLCLDVQLALSP